MCVLAGVDADDWQVFTLNNDPNDICDNSSDLRPTMFPFSNVDCEV